MGEWGRYANGVAVYTENEVCVIEFRVSKDSAEEENLVSISLSFTSACNLYDVLGDMLREAYPGVMVNLKAGSRMLYLPFGEGDKEA